MHSGKGKAIVYLVTNVRIGYMTVLTKGMIYM